MTTPPRPSAGVSGYRDPYDSGTPARRDPGGASPRLWRSASNRVIAGVLGGFAERFGLEALPLRILFALLTFGTGGLLAVLYIVLWAITKERDDGRPVSVAAKFRRSRSSRVIAGVIGGLAEKLGFDATLLRILYVVVSVLSAAFPGILVYLILWMLSEPAEGRDADVL